MAPRDPGPRVVRRRRGGYELRLTQPERQMLRTLPGQLRELLGTDDPSLIRLFPPAHAEDPELETEYREMVGDDLRAKHLESLRVMEATVEERTLDEDQLGAWLGALNDLRLVLGTQLDVTEDLEGVPDDDPRAPAFQLYRYLTWLQSQVVDALAAGLEG
jgi:hypothetical protein